MKNLIFSASVNKVKHTIRGRILESFYWGVQTLVQKELLNLFVSNYFSLTPPPTSCESRDDHVFLNRKLKQQRRRRPRKRHLKKEVALFQTLSRLFHLVQFVKCWQFFLELNSKSLYRSSGKEKKVVVLVFSSTNVVAVQ